jgi:hypothetical protein
MLGGGVISHPVFNRKVSVMALESGWILIVLYAAIFIVASYISYKKQRSGNRVFCIALLLIGLYIVNKTFLLPIPFNYEGLLMSGGDNSVPFKDMFMFVPFQILIDYSKYIGIGEYFLSLSEFFAGSFLIGFSILGMLREKPRTQKFAVSVFWSFAIPIVNYILYIMVKLLTGYVWKYVDLTTLCVFVISYWVGGLISILVCLLLDHANRKAERSKGQQDDQDD